MNLKFCRKRYAWALLGCKAATSRHVSYRRTSILARFMSRLYKKKFDVKDAIMPVILFYLEENSIRASRFIIQISNK